MVIIRIHLIRLTKQRKNGRLLQVIRKHFLCCIEDLTLTQIYYSACTALIRPYTTFETRAFPVVSVGALRVEHDHYNEYGQGK